MSFLTRSMKTTMLVVALLTAIPLSLALVAVSTVLLTDWSYYRFNTGDHLDDFSVWYYDRRPANPDDYNDIQREFYGLDQFENNKDFQMFYFRNRFSLWGHIAIFDKNKILVGTASIYE